MYRKPSGGFGVSFTRFADNAFPAMMFDSVKDPGHISMPQKDMFHGHQISLADPYALDERSLLRSGILDNESISKKVFKKLQKTGVLDPRGNVDTMKIGPKFTHDLAVISAVRQKQIIDLLFWWEEECHRLRKLEGEKRELTVLVRSARGEVDRAGGQEGREEHLDQMTQLLARVNMKIAQRPSERMVEYEEDRDDVMMKYRNSVVNAVPAEASDEALPAYQR